MDRKLASVQKIIKLEPIPNADSIEKATVLGWECVVKKGEFKEGDLCVYIEVDSIVPDLPDFEFLRDRKFRVRTIKLRKQVSQGLVMPLSIIKGLYPIGFEHIKKEDYSYIKEGEDLTELLKIKKYDPEGDAERAMIERTESIKRSRVDKFFRRYEWYRHIFSKNKPSKRFPHFIHKTDEDRIQLFPHICEKEKGVTFLYTEKIDGQSATYALLKNRKRYWEIWKPEYLFIVCSRNIHLRRPDNSSYWRIAKQYKIEEVLKSLILKDEFIILQGEIIGEGIRDNKYKIKGVDFYAFNLIRPPYTHSMPNVISSILEVYGIKWVPILSSCCLKDSIPEMVDFSKGKSLIADTPREGIVVRNYKKGLSFKVINPDFLLHYGE